MMKTRALVALVAVSAISLTACTSDNNADTGSETSADSATVASSDHYPVTIESCGNEVVVEQAPQRAVALNQGITEILLSMGLEDRIVGTATWTDPVLPQLEEANSGIERLADNNASLETVLATDPDFVASSFAGTLADGGSGSFESYAKVGVPAYNAYSDCSKSKIGNDDGERDSKITMNEIHQDIRDLGQFFDSADAAEELISELETRMATVKSESEEVSVAFWFANSESPYMAGGFGAPQIISDQLNLKNVFDDRVEEWPQINWEAVAEADPDVLILGDLTRKSQTAETGDAKIEFLKNHPVTSEMSAVQNDRFIFVGGGDMNPSIRTVDGTEKVSEGLAQLGLR